MECSRIGLWDFDPRETKEGAGGLQGLAAFPPRLRPWRFVLFGFDKLSLFIRSMHSLFALALSVEYMYHDSSFESS